MDCWDAESDLSPEIDAGIDSVFVDLLHASKLGASLAIQIPEVCADIYMFVKHKAFSMLMKMTRLRI